MTVPRPLRPKDYLRRKYIDKTSLCMDAKKWHQERIEQLLKHEGKSDTLYSSIGRSLHRYMQYDADSKGLDGEKMYPE